VQLTDGRRVALDKTWLAGGDLDHGYAMTLHKAQGRTVTTSLVLGDETLSQEGGYVGLSRGTSANHLYLDSADENALRDCSTPLVPAVSPSITAGRTRALTRRVRQNLALEAGLPSGVFSRPHRDTPSHDGPRRDGPGRDGPGQ